MHIWYIHHYGGGPGVGIYDRPYQLARAWERQGHSATIFIASFHHLLEQHSTPHSNGRLVDGVRYIGVPARLYSGNGLSRMLNIWDFSKNLYAAGRLYARDVPPPDAVIASSPHPFSIFAAYKLARQHGAKLIFEIRDIWPLSITEILGTSKLHPFVQMCAAAERFALNRADLVASVLPRADSYLADRGYGSKPFVWVPNGIAQSVPLKKIGFVSKEGREAADKIKEWRSQGRVIISYIGSIGIPNAVDLLLRAIAFGQENGEADGCGVAIIGKGNQLQELVRFAKEKKLSNVYFSGALPKEDAINILKYTDIGYAGLRNIESLFCYGISPNKIADYLNASLPVFLPIEPCGDPVSESGGGIARRVETPEAVWTALRELLLMPTEQRRLLGEKGRNYMAREYDYERIARRYIEAIEKCANGPAS